MSVRTTIFVYTRQNHKSQRSVKPFNSHLYWFQPGQLPHLHVLFSDRSTSDHRQVQPLFLGAIDRDLVTRIGVTHDTGGRVVVQHASDTLGRFVSTVADNHHPRMLGEAHADAAAVVQGNPGRAARGVKQGVEQWPVGHSVGTVLHRLGFAVRAGYRTGVQVVATDDDWRGQFTAANHFVERQAQLGALAQANPADTCRQTLEADALAGHVQPVVQVSVVRDQLFDFGVGLVDVLRVARQRSPTERADATAEQRTDVRRYKTREVKGVFYA